MKTICFSIKILEIHTAENQLSPIRLQEYGVGIFSSIPTKSALKKAIKKRRLLVNGVVATTGTFICGGEEIKLLASAEKNSIKKLVFPLKVLFEDDYLAVISKPAGIAVSGNRFKTIANALEQNLLTSGSNDATSPQPVHRLDYPTTGVLLVGKTSSSIRKLSKLFEEKRIQKTYFAVCIGKMDATGEITSQIDEKEARSHYEVLQTVVSKRFTFLNLAKLSPETGRRHQLRKHLSSIGNPILGDQQYSREDLILKGKGLYLHAYSLNFTHPFTESIVEVKEPLPKKFEKLFPS
ncbi:RluA family pseudouridine synthase [Galbibacter mesophilus]|uniref:RluA family pseudouridine synthase n=1 Tax=Galbibacter mesophilus TaxID=379069 RepID=UPI001A91E8BD|nr:RluA family pseudouridine synthase [Galbibacter mesophilus]